MVAVIEQVPVPESTCSFPLAIEQAVELPASKVTAPVPEPPEVVIVASESPNVADVGAVIDNVAWSALAAETSWLTLVAAV